MNCHKLPSLPGLNFDDRLKQNHHVPQCFYYQNGHRLNRTPSVGIGKEPLDETFKDFHLASEPIDYDPALIYGRTKQQQVEPFRPHFVLFDKKTLKFSGFFRQHVPESRIEHYRIRHVNIFYYLEDDTLLVIEPTVKNCGLSQGKLVRRGKIAKKSLAIGAGNFYTWKDFNIGSDVELHGIVFHITDCDVFSREFLSANGIEVGERECMPSDPVSIDKILQQSHGRKTPTTTTNNDKLRRFLEYSGMVLCFDSVLDETDRPGGELITFKLYFYLEDDTVAIKELPENQQGRDGFSMLLKRTKMPKNWQKKPGDFPAVVFNVSNAEVEEFYGPRDFVIGATIFVFGRKFLILDCDKFTRKYFDQVLRCPQPNKLEIVKPTYPEIKIKLPDYLGLGTPEDSLSSCYNLVPKAPKKDIITYLVNANKALRYSCQLDTAHPEEKDRKFVLSYNLSDGNIQITELAVPNSGITAGKFLNARKVVKPESNPNRPDYYTAKDLYIGALVKVFATRFVINGADLYVYRFMQAHPEFFSPEIIDNVRLYHLKEGNLRDDLQTAILVDHEKFLIEQKSKANVSCAITDALMEKPLNSPVTGERIPKPYLGEEEVKRDYHEKYEKCRLPCTIDDKQEELIPSDKGTVRFLEPHEETH